MISADASDAELVRLSRDGNDAAFSLLVRRYEVMVYRLAKRSLADASAAEDVLQETFVSAWKALDRYDVERPLGAWLRTITLNKVRDRRRRALVRRLVFAPLAAERDAEAHLDLLPDAEEQVGDRQQLDQLQRAIAGLPDRLREALILTTLEGLPQQEAADLLGVTPKAVETRVYRARQRLAEIVKRGGD